MEIVVGNATPAVGDRCGKMDGDSRWTTGSITAVTGPESFIVKWTEINMVRLRHARDEFIFNRQARWMPLSRFWTIKAE